MRGFKRALFVTNGPVVTGHKDNTVQCASCGDTFLWSGMIAFHNHEVWCAWCIEAEEGLPVPNTVSRTRH